MSLLNKVGDSKKMAAGGSKERHWLMEIMKSLLRIAPT